MLYGTTNLGGISHYGTVFRITAGGAFTKLFDFPGTAPQGSFAVSRLVQAVDGLYGTTALIPQDPFPRLNERSLASILRVR